MTQSVRACSRGSDSANWSRCIRSWAALQLTRRSPRNRSQKLKAASISQAICDVDNAYQEFLMLDKTLLIHVNQVWIRFSEKDSGYERQRHRSGPCTPLVPGTKDWMMFD